MIVERTGYDEEYYPKKEALEFFIWFNSMFKEENKPAVEHFQLLDHIYRKNTLKGVECHRGASKTTLVGVYNVLYWIWKGVKPNFGKINYILFVSDTVTQVASIFEHILLVHEESDEYKRTVSIERSRLGDDPTIVFKNRQSGEKIYLRGKGSGQKLRGMKMGGKRPDIIICDDIENDESVESPDARSKLKSWFFNALLPSVNPNKFEIIFIGTPLHQDSLLMNLLESKEWSFIQLPVAEEFPVPKEKIVSAWEDRFTADYIWSIYQMYKEQGRETSFFQEYMLIVTPSENLLYTMGKIKKYSMADMRKNLKNLTYYISVDLAISEKSYADYTAIAVIGVDDNNNWFLVDGFFGRVKPDETINRIFEFVVMYKPYTVVIEKVAFQESMETFLQNEMVLRGVFFSIDMVAKSRGTKKLAVLKGLQPIVELGRLWLPNDYINEFVTELENEMRMITNDKILAKHDDLLDAIAQLTLVNIISAAPIDYEEQDEWINRSDVVNPYIF